MASEATKARRGRKPTRFKFSEDQRNLINSYLPAFDKAVRDLNPGLSKGNEELAKWKVATTKAIMEHDLFQDIEDDSGDSRKRWVNAVKAVFSNHYHYNVVRKSAGTASSSPSNALNVPPALPHLRRALVTLTGDLSARDLFVDSLSDEQVEEAKDSIHGTDPALVGGALRNAAIAQLWRDADRDLWEQKKLEFLSNVDANQEEFPVLIAQSLQDICNGGRLGSILLQLSYGFRGSDGGVVSGSIFTGYDSQNRRECNPLMKDNEEWAQKWETHLDLHLPRQTQPVNHIPINKDNIPVLPPNLDFNRASMGELVQILQDYYLTLWDYSHKSTGRAPPTIPWKDICDHPDRYYNSAAFSLPVKIRDPKDYLDDPVDVFPLLKFFSLTAASETPFQFRSQSDGGCGAAETMPGSSPSGVPSPTLVEPSAMASEPPSMAAASSGSDNVRPSRDSPAYSSSSATCSVPVTGKVTKKKNEISLEPPPPTTPFKPPTTGPVPTVSSLSVTSSTDHKAASGSKRGKRKKGGKSVTNGEAVPTSVPNAPTSSISPPSTDRAVSPIVASSATDVTKAGKKKGRKRVRISLEAPAVSPSTSPSTTQMRAEVGTETEDHGRRKRKVSRRARGIGYDESTPSPAKKRRIA